ncbi:MAG: PAS domain S-box protein [Leptospirales bacterium]|nr:PAS domain S-box protein [Leptospirales bacterium]
MFAIFNNSNTIMLLLDPDTAAILDANPAACRYYNFSREHLLTLKITDINPLPAKEISGQLKSAKVGERGHFFFKHKLANGTLRDVEVYAGPVVLSEGTRIFSIIHDITDRLSMETALRDKEERYRTLAEASTSGIWQIDSTGHTVYMNHAMCQMLEISGIADVSGQTFHDFFPQASLEKMKVEHAKRAQGIMSSYEVELIGRKGKRLNVIVGGAPLIDATGKLQGLIGTFTDVTQHKELEGALRESERRFAYALAATSDGVWEWNYVTGKTYYTARWYEMLGYKDQEFSMDFETWKGLCQPDDFEMAVPTIQKVLAEQQDGYEVEFRMRHKQGHWVWILGRGNVVERNPDGSPLLLAGTNTDITERKLASERIRNTSARLQALLSTIPDLIWLKDVEGRYLACNKMFERYVGAREKDIVGKTDYDFWDQELADSTRAQDARAIAVGGSITNEEWIRFADTGKDALLETIKTPMFDSDGTLIGVLGIGRDITARKETEAELRRKSEEIERFTYTVSHDLRSPLVTIQSFAGFARQDALAEDKENFERDLRTIERAGQKMDSLLQELLEFTRIGRKDNIPVECVLSDIVQEATQLVAGRLAQRKVKIAMEDLPWRVSGDRSRLVALFQNLIDNAAKFMGTQEFPIIEIGSEIQDQGRVFFVRDNGMGIDPKYLDRLFRIFEKLDPAAEGIGMGLAIAQKIVEVHRGRIYAHSEGQGRGTTIFLSLPITGP